MTIDDQIKRILTFKENWDDEGGKVCDKELLDEAVTYIPKLQKMIEEKINLKINDPVIGLCHDGSIDLFWEGSNKFKLLANVKNNRVDYYWCVEQEGKGSIKDL